VDTCFQAPKNIESFFSGQQRVLRPRACTIKAIARDDITEKIFAELLSGTVFVALLTLVKTII
jgi:hypothetical protein